MLLIPERILPSVAIWSPGKNLQPIPFLTCSAAIFSMLPSALTRRASVGFNFKRFVISLRLWPSAYSSKKVSPGKNQNQQGSFIEVADQY